MIQPEAMQDWVNATILSRGGKATGAHPNYYNIQTEEGMKLGIDLDHVNQWKMREEEANIVMIPKDEHSDMKCVQAKEEELEKLKNFDTYIEMPDQGQFRISTTWVLWNKGDKVRARLVARGYEDKQFMERESPTIGKTAMKIILTVVASKQWEIKTTDIKSAFLQGKEIERDVFIKPPKEAKAKGKLWKLKRCQGVHGITVSEL
jgi:hypothetical protein